MKRNTALFGASLAVGVAAATGLVLTSSAAGSYYGVNWNDPTISQGSGGAWTTGPYGDSSMGYFWGTASAGKGTFQTVVGDQVTVSVTCDGADAVTTVTGGGAPGTYQAGQTVSLADFVGAQYAVGSVTFGKASGGHTAGAYIDMSNGAAPGTFVALAGADCSATSPTSTPTTTEPTSTPTSPTSSTTSSTSTTNPPTSSTTSTPPPTTTTSPTTTPTTPPPTTEPPTPTPTTTTLPVTG